MAELMNWACQGVALVLVVTACSRLWEGASASARYRLWWTTLAAVLLLPAPLWLDSVRHATEVPSGTSPIVEVPVHFSLAAPVLVGFWAVWSAASLARLAGAALTIRRMKRVCLPFPQSRERRLTHWNTVRHSGRRACLAVSASAGSAVVLGGSRPVIAISPALLQELDDRELDQIVLHEWAHVQRRDDAALFVQHVIQAIAGMHPAVWWAARKLQLERELACDERVAAITGSPRRYASCLTTLATVMRGHPAAALPCALRRSQLAIRIQHLLHGEEWIRSHPSAACTSAGAAVLAATLGVLVTVPLVGDLAPRIDAAVTSVVLPERPVAAPEDAAPAVERAGKMAARPVKHATRIAVEPQLEPATHALAPDEERAGMAPNTDRMWTVDRLPRGTMSTHLPGLTVPISAPPPAVAQDEVPQSTTPWAAAADAGIAIGHGSTRAARATAGFFTRMGKSIGGRF